MNDFIMIFDHKCECGCISHIDTGKCEKYICPKCEEIIYEKFETLEDAIKYCKRFNERMKK